MPSKMKFSPEVKFCVKYLICHGVNASNFGKVTLSLDENDKDFDLVEVRNNDFFMKLAKGLRELWPPGDKIVNGKGYAWRDSVANLSKRLSTLWNDRFEGKSYTIDECLSAARKYLAQFENDTRYMQTLKFFIWKEKELTMSDGKSKHIIESKFADIIEGKSDLSAVDDEWDNILNAASMDDGEII